MQPDINKKLRVAIYSGSVPSTTFIERLIFALSDKGHHIILHGRKKQKCNYRHKNITCIGFRNDSIGMLKAIFYSLGLLLFWPKAFSALLRQRQHFAEFYSFLRHSMRIAPILFYRPDIFHLQWAKEIEQWMWLRSLGIKLVVSLRGTHVSISPLSHPQLAKTYRKIFPLVDGFHAVSNSLAQTVRGYGARDSKIKVVYSGLDLDEMHFRPPNRKVNDGLKIISIGRSHWLKGYRTSIEACAKLKNKGINFHYTIVGGMSEEMIFLRHQSGLDNEITLTSAIEFDRVKTMLLDSDVLILPSYEEGIANVVLEAMAIGVPVISSNCGGMSEVIQHNENGWLVQVRNANELSETLNNFLNLEPEEVKRIAKNARNTIEARFTATHMATGMHQLYMETLLSNEEAN